MQRLRLIPLALAFLMSVSVAARAEPPEARPDAQLPIRRLPFEVEAESRSVFIGRIEAVGTRYEMQYRTAQVSPDARFWITEMVNTDFRVLVVNALDPAQYDLRVYENETTPTPELRLDQFLHEIQEAVRTVSGVTILVGDERPSS